MHRIGGRLPGGGPPGGDSWEKITDAARTAFRKGVNDWLEQSRIRGGNVQGPNASLMPGSLMSLHQFEPHLLTAIRTAGADPPVAQSLARELWGAWKAWADGFQIQLPGAFPTLGAFPGPQAPPTPAARGVIPLGQGMSAAEVRLKAPTLSMSLKRAVPGAQGTAGRQAGAALDKLARWVDDAFKQWKGSAHLQGLLAQGPVPTFAPPYVPVGPVVGGSVMSTEGTPAIGGVPFGTGVR